MQLIFEQQNIKITLNPKRIESSVTLAAEEGFEPSQTESESVVLPLHNSAILQTSFKGC